MYAQSRKLTVRTPLTNLERVQLQGSFFTIDKVGKEDKGEYTSLSHESSLQKTSVEAALY